MTESGKAGVTVVKISGQAFHEGADDISLSDGHLVVSKGRRDNVVAIYAPGRWVNATISGK